MSRIVVLPSFEKSLKKLSIQERRQATESLESFNSFLLTGHSPVGLGFKKINHDKHELRVNIRLRIVMKAEDDAFYLVFVGSHDTVRRYLRNYR